MNRSSTRFDVVGQLGALRRYARSLVRDDAEAEDLVQDALLRAYQRRAGFRADGNLRAWLMSILHNAFVDASRSRRAEARRIDEAAKLLESAVPPPQEHAARLTRVREHFYALPEEQRAALHLVAIEGLSYAEAAEALNIPLGTLMSRIGRGRAGLRAIEDGRPAGEAGHLRIVGGKP